MGYSVPTMNEIQDFSETIVESVLKSTPKAVRFFLDWHTACAGCGFARFCTLRDVIDTYQLDENKFLEEARELSVQETLTRSSE
ncbi:MAG TPA: hypothetical protein PK152_14520 [Anaerolineales bacterium]|jgi:succinylglutamate desuccinylase|nr:hypothetical protein [Anaerolineae bacterium]HRJ56792.1 hypothetical protein [Anaerolineales bacterium]HRK90348.1 hypothetical protein [Anaerolineales bacterium]